MEGLEFIEPLSSIMRRAINLKKLGLCGAPTLPLFGHTLQLEELYIELCDCPDSIVLPPSLVRLELREFVVTAPAGLVNLFTSGQLPLLKHFEARGVYSSSHDVNNQDISWTNFLQHLKLPSLETLVLVSFLNSSTSDIFSIFKAAPNIPNLKEYEISVYNRDPVDPVLVRQFFSSSLAAKLEDLDLDDVNLGSDEGLAAMLENISCMKRIKKLRLSHLLLDDNSPGQWGGGMQRLDLPKLEYLSIGRCPSFYANDGFHIAEANVPNLKEYSIWGMQRSNDVDTQLLKKFLSSHVYARLEKLKLETARLGVDGVKELVGDALNNKLTSLYINIGSMTEILLIALAGSQGGYPNLRELGLNFNSVSNLEGKTQINYCRNVLTPIWPNLELEFDLSLP
jgi:hypothetical protein